MDLGSLFQIVMFQLVTARDAPYPIALAVIVTAPVVWALTRWWYLSRITKLKRGLVRRDGELAKLRAYGLPGEALPGEAASGQDGAGETAGDDAAPAAPRSAERRTVRLVVNAIDQAALALRSDDPREVDRALSGMALALQAVQSTFDLPVPAAGGDAAADLSAGKAYLERIRPAVRAGDAAAARRLADAALAELNGNPPTASRISA